MSKVNLKQTIKEMTLRMKQRTVNHQKGREKQTMRF